jgi:hypothetical protein
LGRGAIRTLHHKDPSLRQDLSKNISFVYLPPSSPSQILTTRSPIRCLLPPCPLLLGRWMYHRKMLDSGQMDVSPSQCFTTTVSVLALYYNFKTQTVTVKLGSLAEQPSWPPHPATPPFTTCLHCPLNIAGHTDTHMGRGAEFAQLVTESKTNRIPKSEG